jgi:predicted enzyme related to lactoylglutathione lyase
MAHPVTWFQISGADGKKLESFYKNIFSWKGGPDPSRTMMMVKPDKGGIPGGVGKSMSGQASVTVYIDCDDIEGCLDNIEDAGGSRAMEPMDLPGGMGRIAGFLDPEGNWVGLWEPGKPAKKATKKAAKKKPAKKAKKAAKKAKRR